MRAPDCLPAGRGLASNRECLVSSITRFDAPVNNDSPESGPAVDSRLNSSSGPGGGGAPEQPADCGTDAYRQQLWLHDEGTTREIRVLRRDREGATSHFF